MSGRDSNLLSRATLSPEPEWTPERTPEWTADGQPSASRRPPGTGADSRAATSGQLSDRARADDASHTFVTRNKLSAQWKGPVSRSTVC